LTGLTIVGSEALSQTTAQTAGMRRMAAITHDKGAGSLWAGLVVMDPGTESGPHHHGDSESVIYILSGQARFRWGDDLAEAGEAVAGDFIFVPPNVVHQEINPDQSEPLRCVVIRDGGDNVVVNVDAPNA
jgi:uncharacterized RmlC-like cupin family protein